MHTTHTHTDNTEHKGRIGNCRNVSRMTWQRTGQGLHEYLLEQLDLFVYLQMSQSYHLNTDTRP